jgi:hypothetical protein
MTGPQSLHENIAAISAELHTHDLYEQFYVRHGDLLNGFTGIFALCVAMAEDMTAWETDNGGLAAYDLRGTSWIEVVEEYVDTFLRRAVPIHGILPDHRRILRGLPALATPVTPKTERNKP